MDNEGRDFYYLNELINDLEKLRQGEQVSINNPKALYCLSLEIKELKDRMEYLENLQMREN